MNELTKQIIRHFFILKRFFCLFFTHYMYGDLLKGLFLCFLTKGSIISLKIIKKHTYPDFLL